jgi:AcrR family transcriptional regulator
MGIFERKEREKAVRRALIMTCAKELILEYGVEAVSMVDIAKKAELSKATLYLYFPSKDCLFSELCEDAARRFNEYLCSRLQSGLSALEALKCYWQSFVEIFGESEELILIFNVRRHISPGFPFAVCGNEEANDMLSSSFRVFYSMIKNLIDRGIAEGTFEFHINSGMVTRTILSLFAYAVENSARMPKGSQKALGMIDEMRSVFQIMLRGISREGIDRSLLVLPDTHPAYR